MGEHMADDRGLTRRTVLKSVGAGAAGLISGAGAYAALEGFSRPQRAEAAVVRRRQEQYLIDSLEAILDNGVTAVIPPVYNDVVTAKLVPGTWSTTRLQAAASKLDKALQTVESPYPSTAAGLTIVVGWGLPYLRTYVPAPWSRYAPIDLTLGAPAVLDAIIFPSDPASVVLEDNHVAFKLRSDSRTILSSVEHALFEDPTNRAYVGDLFQLTSKRMGFVGRGFGTLADNVGKQLARDNNVPGWQYIPDRSQLMMGFTSTQTAALGPDNIVSFETLPNVTNQWPSGYFAAGCSMHLSHLALDLVSWYTQNDYAGRVARMFTAHTPVPTDGTVTIPNGPAEVTSSSQLQQDAGGGIVGHNEMLQQASRLTRDITDNYGRLRPKGTAVPIREDFNTIDNPFAWPASGQPAAAGLHFAVFVPASRLFHTARLAMDGANPDGTPALRNTIDDAHNGINQYMKATHRQNYLVPPRAHRSFPLVELL
jgi:hypothetical protein